VLTILVTWRIVVSVNIGGYDAGCLNGHIVQCCRHSAGTDGVGISGVPVYLQGMSYIGINFQCHSEKTIVTYRWGRKEEW
jgi:hypothetical protein